MAEQQSTSPFAASMALYSGHLRQRVSQAYQEADRLIKSEQLSQQQQRQIWLELLKADQNNIANLRSRLPKLKKELSATVKDPADLIALTRALTYAVSEQASLGGKHMKDLDEVATKIEDRHTMSTAAQLGIENYLGAVSIQPELATDTAWKSQLDVVLGKKGEKKAKLNKLKKVFADIPDPASKARAFDFLVGSLENKLGEYSYSFTADGTATKKGFNQALASSLGMQLKGGLGLQISEKDAARAVDIELAKKTKELRDAYGPLADLFAVRRKLKKQIKLWEEGENPEAARIFKEAEKISGDIGNAQTKLDELREKLLAPMEGPRDIRAVAGEILTEEDRTLEEIAMQRQRNRAMKLEASSMPAPLKKFLGHLMGAKKYEKMTDEQKQSVPARYVAAMVEQKKEDGEPLNIADMYDQVARDIKDPVLAEQIETMAAAHIINAWNKGKGQRDKDQKVFAEIQKQGDIALRKEEEAIVPEEKAWEAMSEAEKESYARQRHIDEVLADKERKGLINKRGEFDWSYSGEIPADPFWENKPMKRSSIRNIRRPYEQ